MTFWWYVSSPRFTVGLQASHEGRIVSGPPIVQKWIGSELVELIRAWRADRVEALA